MPPTGVRNNPAAVSLLGRNHLSDSEEEHELASYKSPTAEENRGIDLRALSDDLQKLTSRVKVLETLSKDIGSPRDGENLRTKLKQEAEYVKELHRKVSQDVTNVMLQHQQFGAQDTAAVTKLSREFQLLHRKAENTVQEAIRREKQILLKKPKGRKNSQTEETRPRRKYSYTEKETTMPSTSSSSSSVASADADDELDLEEGGSYKEKLQGVRVAPLPVFSASLATAQTEEELAREQLHALKELETDFSELKSVYVDLDRLVQESGEQIRMSTKDVAETSQNTQDGVDSINKARGLAVRSRKKMCILIGVIIAVSAIGVLIVVAIPLLTVAKSV